MSCTWLLPYLILLLTDACNGTFIREFPHLLPVASPVAEPNLTRKSFPAGFVFGTATSAYQVEGAIDQAGRGKSIWDTFSHRLGNVLDLTNGDIADDHYNWYKSDVELIKSMSVDAYRFSISWSRIFSSTSRFVNDAGIAHYNDVINTLLSKGIQPYVTLYHWDLPQALQDEYGGWLSSNIIDDFILYANTCFAAFGDRVKHWITINEPYSFSSEGYAGFGTQAPQRCSFRLRCSGGDSSTEPYIVAHYVLLAHASVVALYKEIYQAQQGGIIGITIDSRWYEPLNATNEEDKKASKRALDFQLGWFLDPLIFGDYPISMKELVGDRLPTFQQRNSTKAPLKGSFDFIGLNHYTTNYVHPGEPSYLVAAIHNINQDGQFDVSYVRNGESIGPRSPGAAWLYVVPWGFKKILDYIRIQYNNPPIIITENGYADINGSPLISLEHALDDVDRIMYHEEYLSSLLSAIKDGSDVRGYFVWSLLDNWEWGLGLIPRFGVYFVDYMDHLKRYPKKSVAWFQQFLQN
ncbi:hypothetical protein L7F22_039767 [Adiantum nelumboides]|nr:hypothetical protein [Adiantum nelumboides]